MIIIDILHIFIYGVRLLSELGDDINRLYLQPTSPMEDRPMSHMTVERLHELFDENPEKEVLAWSGVCHDCNNAVSVSATPQADGIRIQGGSVYEPEANKFIVKCDACFMEDPLLRHFQDCEVYSRVVGYLRPVAQWNDAKQSEFDDRKLFDSSL